MARSNPSLVVYFGLFVCAPLASLGALAACGSDAAEPPPRVTQPVDAGTLPDATPKREAGVPTKCAVYAGSTSNDSCSCGETEAPFGGAATEVCPLDALPHYCVSYDVTGPPLRRECTCQPRCLFQKVTTGGGGDGGAGDYDTCRCGGSSFLTLGGAGSRDETRASCDGYATCCKFNVGCDCSNEPGFTCPANATKVPSCSPADFNEKAWRATVYGGPAFGDIVDVARCK